MRSLINTKKTTLTANQPAWANELMVNNRAKALGNNPTAESFHRADYTLDCANGICTTTWKPSVMKSSR